MTKSSRYFVRNIHFGILFNEKKNCLRKRLFEHGRIVHTTEHILAKFTSNLYFGSTNKQETVLFKLENSPILLPKPAKNSRRKCFTCSNKGLERFDISFNNGPSIKICSNIPTGFKFLRFNSM